MRHCLKFRFAGILIMLAALTVFSGVVMLIWNALCPGLFGLPTLTYLQAAGLLALARILFGGFGVRHHEHADPRVFRHNNKLREKWMNMSEDERKEFLEKEKEFFKFDKRFSHFHRFFDDEAPGQNNQNNGAEK